MPPSCAILEGSRRIFLFVPCREPAKILWEKFGKNQTEFLNLTLILRQEAEVGVEIYLNSDLTKFISIVQKAFNFSISF